MPACWARWGMVLHRAQTIGRGRLYFWLGGCHPNLGRFRPRQKVIIFTSSAHHRMICFRLGGPTPFWNTFDPIQKSSYIHHLHFSSSRTLRCAALRCAALPCAALHSQQSSSRTLRCAALSCATLRCAAVRCPAPPPPPYNTNQRITQGVRPTFY